MLMPVFGAREFDARELSSALRSAGITMHVKLASNELRRLHFMDFLKRRRVKREARLEDGRACCRGFKYLYSISKQGISYAKYQASPERDDDWVDKWSERYIEENYPEHMWKLAKLFVLEKPGKACPRFPRRADTADLLTAYLEYMFGQDKNKIREIQDMRKRLTNP